MSHGDLALHSLINLKQSWQNLLCHYLQPRILSLEVDLQLGSFMSGSEYNDEFYMDEHGRVRKNTNRSGGIQVKFFNFQKALVWTSMGWFCSSILYTPNNFDIAFLFPLSL